MASIFGHAALALGMGGGMLKDKNYKPLLIAGIISSMLPDLDVIGFSFGVKYMSIFGHRGFSHSLIFALFWGLFLSYLLFKKYKINERIGFVYIFLCTISHGVLDAMTTGGKGVGFFIPFDNERYFLPFRFIKVSPLGISNFFSKWGAAVVWNELQYILVPSLILGVSLYFISSLKVNHSK